jgi:receptor-binding protein
MEPLDQIRLSRRGVFRAGAAVGAGALGSGLLATGTANATLPPSPEFDLGATPQHLFGPKILNETHHSMQGFTFDDVNRRLFIVQPENGGSGSDLVINQVSASGAVLGAMTIRGAGHGVSIAAEPVGDITYIWVECDVDQNNGDGRGTALARVQFKNIVRTSIANDAKFFTGSDTITAAVDPVNKRLMVRRKENGSFYLSVWPLSKAREGNAADRLVHVKQPSYSRTFQGYTFYGQYAYLWYGDGQTNPDNINSTIRTVDLNTGEFTRDPAVTRAGESLVYREPEGMAIHRMDSGDLALFFGFASRPSDGGDNRYANLYYKLLG